MNLQPPCALPCLSSAMVAMGCAYNDLSCGCNSSAQSVIASLAGPCLLQNCPATQLVDIGNAGQAACSAWDLTHAFSGGSLTTSAGASSSSLVVSTTRTSASATGTGSVGGSGSSSMQITTSPTLSTVRQTSTSTSTGTAATDAAPLNTSSSPRSNLSTGAIIGAGIGGVAILCTLITAVFICLRRRPSRAHNLVPRSSFSETAELFPSFRGPDRDGEGRSEMQMRVGGDRYELSENASAGSSGVVMGKVEQAYELDSESSLVLRGIGGGGEGRDGEGERGRERRGIQPLRLVERMHTRRVSWEQGDDLGEERMKFAFRGSAGDGEEQKSRRLQKAERGDPRATIIAEAREEREWGVVPRYG